MGEKKDLFAEAARRNGNQNRLGWALQKLAILKENFDYRDFYPNYKERFFCSGSSPDKVGPDCLPGQIAKFGIDCWAFLMTESLEKVLDLLDPKNDQADQAKFSDKFLAEYVPKLFIKLGITQVEDGTFNHEYIRITPLSYLSKRKLLPNEKLLLIDVTAKKEQLVQEFKTYLDLLFEKRAQVVVSPEHPQFDYYSSWQPFLSNETTEYSREIKEVWQHLEIWKMRIKRISFKEISIHLKITKEAAKKSYYKAYELTQKKKYQRKYFSELLSSNAEAGKKCTDCTDKPYCVDPCPDMIARLSILDPPTREKIFGKEDAATLA